MELRLTCQKCGAEYRISDEKLKSRPMKFSCKRCDRQIILRPAEDGIKVEGGSLRSPFESNLPESFGRFHGLKRLASGGMGDIYLAKMGGAEGFEREVALKVLHAHLAKDANFARAMVDEAKLTVLLHHPNIVQMYNLEKAGDLLYCVMEHVPGMSLAAIQRTYRLKGGNMPVPMAIFIATEALEGLAYAHELKDKSGEPLVIVHRDISPQNILVTVDGWVKIIDFGIAKAATRISQTRPGMVKGKFAYMAPEQLKGESDHRVDLFALGVVLWETLAGVRLFHSSTDVDTLQKILHMDPPPIHLTRTEIPKALDDILHKAMHKDPSKRFSSAREFKAALLDFVAPATPAELRASVDIEATALGDVMVLPDGATTGEFDDITPVVEPAEPEGRPVGQTGPRWGLWGGLLLVGLVLGLGAWWGLPYLRGDPDNVDAGSVVVPAEDAGTVAIASDPVPPDAGTHPVPGDPGEPVADSTGPGLDAGSGPHDRNVASMQPDRRRIRPAIKLTRKNIEKVLRKNGAKLQRCADVHLTKQGTGKDVELLLDFTIAANGKVTRANLKPKSLEPTEFGRCLIGRVRVLKFPRHVDKNVSISFPLRFKVVAK